MSENLKKAKNYLDENSCTCVAVKGEQLLSSFERGVAPLLKWLDGRENFDGYSVADKVVGRGAAFLYVKLGVAEVYASVISELALEILLKYGIRVEYFEKVNGIKNRKGDGFCPIETAVKDVICVDAAIGIIRETVEKLRRTTV